MAAKLGAHVSMVGSVGNDIFADQNIEFIKSSGADTSLIQRSKTSSTGVGVIHVSEDGENCIAVTLGANLEVGAKRAREVENEVAKASLVLCQSEIDQEGNIEVFKVAKKHSITTFFNPAPGRADLDKTILPLTDIICTNENEAEFITGLTLSTLDEFKDAAKKMLELGPRIAIVTMGPKGAVVAQRTKSGVSVDTVDVPKVTAVDTTGAGDCFCGSLAYFITQNSDGNVVEMVKKAAKIAAISVQRHGAMASYPDRSELEKLGIV